MRSKREPKLAPTAKTMLSYFAYASNMAPEVMDLLCPSNRFVGPAELPDHRLAFTRRSVRTHTGVADIVRAPGSSVWGALYELAEHELGALDQKEGSGWAYTRVQLVVVLAADRSHHEAIGYQVLRPEPREVRPSPQYLKRIVSAARARRLPAHYVDWLQSTV